MSDLVDAVARTASRQLAERTEEWLRGLGIETEDDARALAEHYEIKYDPVKLTHDGSFFKATQTVRLVRRGDTPTPS